MHARRFDGDGPGYASRSRRPSPSAHVVTPAVREGPTGDGRRPTTVASTSEVLAMRRALALACTPGVPTGPNPRVGAIVLDAAGQVVGEGHHRGAGSPHAEVAAIQAAGANVRG